MPVNDRIREGMGRIDELVANPQQVFDPLVCERTLGINTGVDAQNILTEIVVGLPTGKGQA